MNMALMTNREPTNEIISTKIIDPDVELKDFSRERTQAKINWNEL